MLEIKALSAQIGSFRLHPLDMVLREGERHLLLGASGAGKSTLLDLIVGFRSPQSGQITLDGRDLLSQPIEKRPIGYLPQKGALFPHLSVKENIRFSLRFRKEEATDKALWERLLAMLRLSALLDRSIHQLSGGERQRIALARALFSRPRFLLLDEPFSSLDTALRQELWRDLLTLLEAHHIGLLMVTHDLEEAFYLSTTLHILLAGRLEQSAPKEEGLRYPKSLAVARFLGLPNLYPARCTEKNNDGAWWSSPLSPQPLFLPHTHAPNASAYNQGDEAILGLHPDRLRLLPLDNTDQSSPSVLVKATNSPSAPEKKPLLLNAHLRSLSPQRHSVQISLQPEGSDAMLQAFTHPLDAAMLFPDQRIALHIEQNAFFLLPRTDEVF